jgi:hypothetical protein
MDDADYEYTALEFLAEECRIVNGRVPNDAHQAHARSLARLLIGHGSHVNARSMRALYQISPKEDEEQQSWHSILRFSALSQLRPNQVDEEILVDHLAALTAHSYTPQKLCDDGLSEALAESAENLPPAKRQCLHQALQGVLLKGNCSRVYARTPIDLEEVRVLLEAGADPNYEGVDSDFSEWSHEDHGFGLLGVLCRAAKSSSKNKWMRREYGNIEGVIELMRQYGAEEFSGCCSSRQAYRGREISCNVLKLSWVEADCNDWQKETVAFK